MRSGLIVALSFIGMLPLVASAQTLEDLTTTSSFTVSASPQYPAPNSQVTLSFLSSSIDLTNATLAVSVSGKNIYQGSVRPVAVTIGKAGSITPIVATISSGGASYRQTLSIQPQDVSLIAEPVSSSPPLYPGKSFVPLDGSIRVVAIANLRGANGQTLNPNTLSYSWTVDGVQIANSSGIGKATVIVASPLQYRARDISVVVMNQNGSLVGGANLSLSATDPLVRVYVNDPLLGIRFEKALSGSYTISGSEATLYAAPFSLPTTNGAPLLQWFLNGSAAQTGNSITLRPTGSGRGNASLSLTASTDIYSLATINLSLIFGTTPSFNLFGL